MLLSVFIIISVADSKLFKFQLRVHFCSTIPVPIGIDSVADSKLFKFRLRVHFCSTIPVPIGIVLLVLF